MSFLKDLIAWKSRGAEPVGDDEDFDADDDWLLEDDGDPAGGDLPPELAGLLDRDSPRQQVQRSAPEPGPGPAPVEHAASRGAPTPSSDGARPARPVRPERPAVARPAAAAKGENENPEDGAEDDLLARIARQHAEAPPAPRRAEPVPEVPNTRPVSQPGGPEMPSRRPATPPKIWELHGTPPAPAPAPDTAPQAPRQPSPAAASPQAAPDPAGPAGRAKTRLLGFHHPGSMARDPFEDAAAAPSAAPPPADPEAAIRYPTGWIVVIDGPGRGACFTLTTGVSQIGRGSDQAIRLDFGDQSISRRNHAAIAYDEELGEFFLGHGGKLNLVRLNGRPVLSTESLNSCDTIRIGETTLKFIAFCNEDFSWSEESDRGPSTAAR